MTSEIPSVHPSEIFGGKFTSTLERIEPSYSDRVVHQRSIDIMGASGDDRLSKEAQLVVYLAASYALYPEESKIIIDSLRENDGEA